MVETIRALREDGFDGFFSLEPHLADYNALGGFSGPELLTSAWKAFTDILKREGIGRMTARRPAGPPTIAPAWSWSGRE